MLYIGDIFSYFGCFFFLVRRRLQLEAHKKWQNQTILAYVQIVALEIVLGVGGVLKSSLMIYINQYNKSLIFF
jgi:hypothetical protein